MIHHWTQTTHPQSRHCLMCPCRPERFKGVPWSLKGVPWSHSDCKEVTSDELEGLLFFEALLDKEIPRYFRLKTWHDVPIIKDEVVERNSLSELYLFDVGTS